MSHNAFPAMAEEPAPDEPARERKGIRKGIYVLPSLFTAANIGMGYYAVMGALRGFQLLESDVQGATAHFDNAARAIGWAILFDALDGRIARLTKTTTEIGIQFDSIADVLTFGIAPAVLVYAWGCALRWPWRTKMRWSLPALPTRPSMPCPSRPGVCAGARAPARRFNP
jgi:uncharacterized protein YunC (DUF1805 family)